MSSFKEVCLSLSVLHLIKNLFFSDKITELAGYTARVSEMLHVFEEAKKGRYVTAGTVADQSRGI